MPPPTRGCTAVAALPHDPGVYRFRDGRGRVIYVGRASDLRSRVGSYWGDLLDRPHLRRMVGQIERIEAIPCDSAHEAAWLERNLLERSRPRWNRVRGGLEVPTWIVLEQGPGSARLRVTHAPAEPPAESFGPYLGGTRSRLAVAALDRVVGLAYAGDGLGGSERDMARVRGVRATERVERVALVRAVLAGEPAAVRTVSGQLTDRRDDAARALAYEVAAAVQDELSALLWVTARQRVTTRADGDADIRGWAGGVLVQLTLTAGRVDRWQQRPCTAAQAAPQVEGTAEEWREFAERAAELAALLVRAHG